MLWVIALHITAMLFWCAALLYLPALIPGGAEEAGAEEPHARGRDGLPRILYTHVATPAALLAIASGTLVFLLQRQVDIWLISKLTLVTGLVMTHVLTGVLVARGEQPEVNPQALLWGCRLLALAMVLLMLAIVWVVLAKPLLQVFPWGH